VADARQRLGRDVQIGVTCHASRHLAMEAGEAGADTWRSVRSIPAARNHRAAPELLAWWSAVFELPCVASVALPRKTAALVTAGADFLAVARSGPTIRVWMKPGPSRFLRHRRAPPRETEGLGDLRADDADQGEADDIGNEAD
jgi:thiamine-phosphate pyrophosphorylase